ncbi:MAG: hypothetical protein Kow0069_38410 [Promethearchaeota archaeon]
MKTHEAPSNASLMNVSAGGGENATFFWVGDEPRIVRAAVFEEVKKIVVRDDYPDPQPGLDEVVVRVRYCAICGSDVKNWLHKIYEAPLVMGHEFCGEVVELGPGMEDSGFHVGDKVTGINPPWDTRSGASMKGLGVFQDGAFAEFVRVPREALFRVPDEVSHLHGALIESFAVAVRAVAWAGLWPSVDVPAGSAPPPAGQTGTGAGTSTGAGTGTGTGTGPGVVVVGGGAIGLATLATFLAGRPEPPPAYSLVVEPHAFLREKALQLGATHALPPNKGKLRRLFRKLGEPWWAFEAAGLEATLLLAMDLVAPRGTVVVEGVGKGHVTFPSYLLNSKEVGLRGSLSHDVGDVRRAIDLVRSGAVDLDPFVSEVIPLGEIESGFAKYVEPGERKFVKILVEVS